MSIRMEKKKRRRLAGLGAMLIMFLGLLYLEGRLPQVLVYNGTASVDTGWYLLLSPENIEAGDMVVFRLPEDMQRLAVERGWLPKGRKLLKKVGAVTGDSYGVNNARQFLVRGKYCGQASLYDGLGRRMPDEAIGNHIVPEGAFLPVGENPMSFDGRYYGTVPEGNIEHKAVLVLPTSWMRVLSRW